MSDAGAADLGAEAAAAGGAARVRLLVKDPEWLFVYWELPPESRAALRAQAGDRAGSLARVTLRLLEGPTARDVIPRSGSDSHYLRVERPGAPVAVVLGWTLPSGRFEPLARSEAVTPPLGEPAPTLARARVVFPSERDRAAGLHARQLQRRRPLAPPARPAPRGGASDAFAPPGASDAFRPAGGRGR